MHVNSYVPAQYDILGVVYIIWLYSHCIHCKIDVWAVYPFAIFPLPFYCHTGPSVGYHENSRRVEKGGFVVVLAWAHNVTPLEPGHLKLSITTSAFQATVGSRARERYRKAFFIFISVPFHRHYVCLLLPDATFMNYDNADYSDQCVIFSISVINSNNSFTAGYLEKTLSEWWGKFAIIVN